MSPFFQKLRSLLHRRRKEEDLRDELQFHLDEEAAERQAEGLSGEEARHAGEERYLNLGATAQGRILLVVTTWREDRVRVVTAFEPIKRLI
jgi:uncharacterized DUF497 family protein